MKVKRKGMEKRLRLRNEMITSRKRVRECHELGDGRKVDYIKRMTSKCGREGSRVNKEA